MIVLIVEDNANDRKLLRLNLEKHGCEAVIEARNGQEGFALAREHRPDLIISDALMPQLDGFELLRLVKMDDELKGIPFVFHSSVYAGKKDEELALRLGAAAFIPKPQGPEELWGELAGILERFTVGEMKAPSPELVEWEGEYLREYSGVVTSKLAEKVRELEESLARLKEREEELLKLSAAIEQSPVTIVITDAQGKIEYVNPKFTQMTGYSSEEALGKNPRIMKSGETPPEEYAMLWATISSGNVWHGEFHNRKMNGELFWEQATISPVKSRDGVITHYIAIKEDVTERRSLESQLRQAQKMETIGQIAGGVAHDFNNLLQAITTYGFLIQRQLKENGLPTLLVDEQMAATQRAVELTSGLLTFSRKQALNPKPLDLNRILAESQKFIQRIIGEDIDFKVYPAPHKLNVRADEGGMHQVLINLATNARDAMPGGGSLTISTAKIRTEDAFIICHGCSGSGEFALISVTDTGEGVAQEDLQRIFEPFFTTKVSGKGTGLGLAIIYGIIRQHNGFIEVDSEKGQGTSFRIYLPLLPDQTETSQKEPELEIPQGSGTILLVEDESMVRRSLKSVISSYGYSVMEAADGEEAVKIFRENAGKVDLVILDMIMPGKNGLETLQEIRTIKPDTRHLFLSGYTADILESKGIEEGGKFLIMKPVNPPLLLEAIRNLLNPVHAEKQDKFASSFPPGKSGV